MHVLADPGAEPDPDGADAETEEVRWVEPLRQRIVITSYSIHYTKLSRNNFV